MKYYPLNPKKFFTGEDFKELFKDLVEENNNGEGRSTRAKKVPGRKIFIEFKESWKKKKNWEEYEQALRDFLRGEFLPNLKEEGRRKGIQIFDLGFPPILKVPGEDRMAPGKLINEVIESDEKAFGEFLETIRMHPSVKNVKLVEEFEWEIWVRAKFHLDRVY